MIVILCAGVAIRFSSVVDNAQKDLNQERYSRMVAEESLEKANNRINSLEADLVRTQNTMKGIEGLIKETKGINEDLKNQLEKSSRINEELDKKIKEFQQSPAPSEASPSGG